MRKATIVVMVAACVLASGNAWAVCSSYPNILTNGSTADATQVMADFNCAALTSGATLNAVTQTGITSFPGNTTIDASGKVGVSTTVPWVKFSTNTGVSAPSSSAYTGGFLVGDATNATNSGLEIGAANTSPFGVWLQTKVGPTGNLPGTYPLVIQPLGGSVGIGTSSPGYTLHVNGSVAGTSAYVNLSDARLKKDVVPISGALSIIDKLNGVRFDWRTPREREIGKTFNLPVGTPQVGFIAQDVKAILPEAVSVSNDHDHTLSVAESKIVPVLVAAMKELKSVSDAQKAQLAKQLAEIDVLRTQVSQLVREGTRTASN